MDICKKLIDTDKKLTKGSTTINPFTNKPITKGKSTYNKILKECKAVLKKGNDPLKKKSENEWESFDIEEFLEED